MRRTIVISPLTIAFLLLIVGGSCLGLVALLGGAG